MQYIFDVFIHDANALW